MKSTTAVIGAGGLLGHAARLSAPRDTTVVPVTGLDWTDVDLAATDIERVLAQAIGNSTGRPLHLLWCAGGGRVGTDADAMETERRLLDRVISGLVGLAQPAQPVSFCLASSGGGVWSGAPERILDESVPAAPWHDYGRGKLAQEETLRQLVAGTSVRAVVARISNLYGRPPDGHGLTGLVNHLVLNAIHRRPTGIYVPLDTQRDYLSATSAAGQMHALARASLDNPPGSTDVRVVAAGRSVTISSLAVVIGRVLGRRIPITVGHSPTASAQPRALAFRSLYADLPATTPHLAHDMGTLVRDLLTWRG